MKKDNISEIYSNDLLSCIRGDDCDKVDLGKLAKLITDINIIAKPIKELHDVFTCKITSYIRYILKCDMMSEKRQKILDILYQCDYVDYGFLLEGHSLLREAVLQKDWYNFKYLLPLNADVVTKTIFSSNENKQHLEVISIWDIVHNYKLEPHNFKKSIIEVLEQPLFLCNKKINMDIDENVKHKLLNCSKMDRNSWNNIRYVINLKTNFQAELNSKKQDVLFYYLVMNHAQEKCELKMPKPLLFLILEEIYGITAVRDKVENCLK